MKRTKILLILALAPALACAVLIPSGAGEPSTKARKEPNLLLDVSANLVNAVVQRPVDRSEAIQDFILERPVQGVARTLGTVSAELVPDASHASVNVLLQGTNYSRTVAILPQIQICTVATTPLKVCHRVVMDGKGIRTVPGAAHADATTELLDISGPEELDHFTYRVVHRGFYSNKIYAEAETSYKTAWGASTRLANELYPVLARGSQAMGRGFREIQQAGLTLEYLDFNTTASFLQARVRIIGPGSAEPSPAPAMPADIDFGLRFHQSLINEAAKGTLGGKTFSVHELIKALDEAPQGFLHDSRKESEKAAALKALAKLIAGFAGKSATITLAAKDPVTVGFTEQGFSFEVHIASIRLNGTVIPEMRGAASYRLENTKEGMHAVRIGPARFMPSEEPTPAQRKLGEALFGEILSGQFLVTGLPMPVGVAHLRFLPPRVGARNGWLALGWTLKAS